MFSRNEGYGLIKVCCWNVQNKSVAPVKTWLTAACASKVLAAIRARRGSSIVGSAHHSGYVTNVCDGRRDVNVSAKNTVLDALKGGQESVRYARTCPPNALAIVSSALHRVSYHMLTLQIVVQDDCSLHSLILSVSSAR